MAGAVYLDSMIDQDAEMGAIAAELEAAGLVTAGTDADGHETWMLTEMGA